MTLKDTMVHFMTLCDGVYVGVFMVDRLERNIDGSRDLNRRTIYSGSLQ